MGHRQSQISGLSLRKYIHRFRLAVSSPRPAFKRKRHLCFPPAVILPLMCEQCPQRARWRTSTSAITATTSFINSLVSMYLSS